MIKASVIFKDINERGAVINTDIEVEGICEVVKYEMVALLDRLRDVDGGKTLCDAMAIQIDNLRSQKA